MECPITITPNSQTAAPVEGEMQIDCENHRALNPGPIATVLQSEAAFTVATAAKPILATYGCGPCVAVAGYDPTNKMAFLVHVASPNEVAVCGNHIWSNISQFMRKQIEKPIQIHLVGGHTCAPNLSKITVQYIKSWMRAKKDLPMTLVSQDILSSDRESSKSLWIDSRDGTTGQYCPRQDPHPRKITKADYAAASASVFHPKITIAYMAPRENTPSLDTPKV